MGTRHLIAVRHEGDWRIAQYGQWDGYPEGQGIDVLNFCRNNIDTVFEEKLRNCRFISQEEEREAWIACGADLKDGFVSMDVANKFHKKFPLLSRDLGADVLKRVYASEGEVYLRNTLEFAKNSLFCEWAYVIDLDEDVLEVYNGFNKKPVKGRFASNTSNEDGYYPVSLLHTFDFNELPSNEEFIEILNSYFTDNDD